ncbi:ATP-dependent helicase HrpA [Xanthomonas hyacinthi]|uniref:ATP-dependent helicase HrpA n=1 Tax=Xanthomonas hyacinthi TaxID=56455 RepID=A0A2S7ERB5_9XANT|nr:hypothetical protein [Xanthomonas hyacinthi]KLD76407.1 hypothetical protein Y886_21610 [Xanthomonas hyacinthi DSM 19077]PPU95653.1 hypothetical protein XhyaCFBP1156_17885 [Xanthomonas hyacinthi]QGY78063.1 ATP-dependent helicase HrpA [Xanthomonas hyacinthi]
MTIYSSLFNPLIAGKGFLNQIGTAGLSAATSMGNTAIAHQQIQHTLGSMSANVTDQENMMDQITQMQNELNMRMAMDQLIKQAGSNAKSLTQG